MKELKRSTKQEMMIADARSEGLSFCELKDLEMRVVVDQIMFRGAAITGCCLPQTESLAKFIADEIIILIFNFGYQELTEQEIFLSMRLNALGDLRNPCGEDFKQVSFSGNSMNTVYLAKVFKNYMSLRNNLDRKIQNELDGY